MEYVKLGKSGLKVSKVILGAMSYGDPKWQGWVLPEEESLPLLEHAWKSGINTWDTADTYSNGRSEEIIGKAITKYNIPREDLVILTKCFYGANTPMDSLSSLASKAEQERSAPSDEEEFHLFNHRFAQAQLVQVNKVGLSRKAIFSSVEGSVKRLGTYIDVLQIHRLDRDTDREEIMKALNDVIEKGWVRYIGASSMYAWEFQTLQNIAERNGWHKFISMQNYYNLLYREEEREMIPYCKDSGVGLIPWSPLARGILCRPWSSTETTHSSDETSRTQKDPWLDACIPPSHAKSDSRIVSAVESIAKEKGDSMAKVATAWVLSKGIYPIVGLGSKKRIDEAVASVSVKLTDGEIKRLEEAYVPKVVGGLW